MFGDGRFSLIPFSNERPGRRRVGAPESGASRRGTVLLYSHDSFGLGHLRRNTAIAHALLKRNPALRVVLLSGSPVAGEWPLPAEVELVRLPVAVKVGADRYVSADRRSMAELRAQRAAIMKTTLLSLRPDVFLVDHTPLGIKGELVPALVAARSQLPQTRVIIGLRDVLDDASVVRDAWRTQGVYAALEDFYDQILVYGCRDLYDVTTEYDFSSTLARRTTFTGYISKDPSLESPAEPAVAWKRMAGHRVARVLVMGGGGGDAGDVFRVFLKAWKRTAGVIHGQALLVLGPLMNPSTAASIERRAAGVDGVQIVRSSKSLLSLIAAADLVVSMGGYNTVVESLAARKPMVLCPRVAPRTEQLIRAGLMARLGLARVVRLDRESSKALAEALEAALLSPDHAARQPPIDLGGAEQVAAIVVAAVTSRGSELIAT